MCVVVLVVYCVDRVERVQKRIADVYPKEKEPHVSYYLFPLLLGPISLP